jgi:hypothetical protein
MALTTRRAVEFSTFQNRPAYNYIRASDKLPTYDAIGYDTPSTAIECRVRLFNPTGIGTWWIAAYDSDTRIAWGVAQLHEREVGSFSMEELSEFRGLFGLPIERDLYYTPTSLHDIIEGAR